MKKLSCKKCGELTEVSENYQGGFPCCKKCRKPVKENKKSEKNGNRK